MSAVKKNIAPGSRDKDVIGSSEVAAIVGLSPYLSPFELAVIKKGLGERQHHEYLTGGKDLEQVVAKMWARREKKEIRWIDEPRVGPEDWIVASPDMEVLPDDGGEVKTLGYRNEGWGEPGTDQVPEYIVIQASWLCLVMNWKRVYIPAFINRDTIPTYVVERDDELIGLCVDKAAQFRRDYLLTDKMPTITAPGEVVDSYIRKRFPKDEVPVRNASPEELSAALRLAEVKAQIGALEKDKGILEAGLKEAIGEAAGIEWLGGRITWKNVKTSSKVEWEAVARELGADEAIVKKHTREAGGYRRFLLSLKGGSNGN